MYLGMFGEESRQKTQKRFNGMKFKKEFCKPDF